MKIKDERLLTDLDFILSDKYNNSLQEMLSERPDGSSISAISKVLGTNSKDLKKELDRIINKIRQVLNE